MKYPLQTDSTKYLWQRVFLYNMNYRKIHEYAIL